MRARRIVYRVARALGLFALSRRWFSRRLLILGYHGFAYRDEARFRPGLFMSIERFEQRLALLRERGHPVLPLEEALRRLREGSLPPNSVVITIDDGFHSVLGLAAPVLRRHGMPATLYVTSYHVEKGTPIFRLAVQYLFWRCGDAALERLRDMRAVDGLDLEGVHSVEEARRRIIRFGESAGSEALRQTLLERLATAFGEDYRALCETRLLSLVSVDELPALEAAGIRVELHTHRHVFPASEPERARSELEDNRRVLEPALGRRLTHFCYPSGLWSPRTFDVLREAGVVSAVTCEPGLNDAATEPLALHRILDRDDLDEIEFEAELSGFGELLRRLRGRGFGARSGNVGG